MMRLALLVGLVMVAFAANSVLNRMAVGPGLIDALDFAVIRAAAGAGILALLVMRRGGSLPLTTPGRHIGAATLSIYLVGFSLAYTAIDAGVGALLLFGAVQITMFAGGLIGGERPGSARWIGAVVAFAGLAWLVWPTETVALPVAATLSMLAAGIGWGMYSLAGRRATDPLADTAANFAFATPICALALVLPLTQQSDVTLPGAGLAIISGAITSGVGYALWYAVLPRLKASAAGLVQLSVPVIAALGGVVLLAEPVTWRFAGAAALVIGGIAFGLLAPQRTKSSSGS